MVVVERKGSRGSGSRVPEKFLEPRLIIQYETPCVAKANSFVLNENPSCRQTDTLCAE